MNIPLLKDAPDLRGRRVLLRLDLNLPLAGGTVSESFRFDRAGETISYLRQAGARTLIVSHLESKESASLAPVFTFLSSRMPVTFAATFAEAKEALARAPEGTFVLLENVRSWKGEKDNDEAFAKELASLCDLYVNEAFSASHRSHASLVGVPTFLPHYAGFLFEEEVRNLSRAFSPKHPALLILGGAKFETKLPLVERFLEIMDDIYLCGALANDVYRKQGYEVGTSLVSATPPDPLILENPKIHVPVDVTISGTQGAVEKAADQVEKSERIVDAGPYARDDLRTLISRAEFVLWNGPLGEHEHGFVKSTLAVAQALAESDAESIIGGGDSLAAVSKLGLLERFSFVSTGGGAMLDFLANKTLPGIEALRSEK